MPPRRFAPTGDPALKTVERKRLRLAVAKGHPPCMAPVCYLPGVPIDYEAKRGPASYVLGEIVPRVLGGSPVDPVNVRPEHHRCNAIAGVQLANKIKQAKRSGKRSPNRAPITADCW